MRYICYDGYYCCEPDCDGLNNGGSSPGSSSSECPDCIQVGDYYVHDQDSVPPGCSGEDSNIQINLNRNDYDACDGSMSFEIIDYDATKLSEVSIVDNLGNTSILATIDNEIPHGTYTTIIYKASCSDGTAVFGQVHLASKHLCLDCDQPENCDPCTGDCNEIDLGVS